MPKPDQPAVPAANSPQPASSTMPFETSLAELGDIVARLESGALGLSDSIGAYERGVSILHGLHEQLAAVEERVRLLVRIDEQGRPVLQDAGPQPPQAADAPADAPARRTPRTAGSSARAKRLPGMDDAGGDVYDSAS